ncbi:MAG: hypothetical protein ABIH88_01905 [Patescibacteria group bacterium]
MNKIGICFSRPFEGNDPLRHIGKKLPVYIRFLNLCQGKGWQVFVLTRKTYKGEGVFEGSWRFEENKFYREEFPVKIDLVYDRTAGMNFPPEGDSSMAIVDQRNFKKLCYDKFLSFKKIGGLMPETFWIGDGKNLVSTLEKLKTDWVVLKPYNGLKGIGIFIGPKKEALNFKFPEKNKGYIAQEFLDTSSGIPGIVEGLHDLRVVIINRKIVWSHVRTPPKGSFKANVALGGDIKEVDCDKLPESVKQIAKDIDNLFFEEYDNPLYSMDLGFSKNGPLIFELNDQIGFPTWEMKARDKFLNELIKNFESKLGKRE